MEHLLTNNLSKRFSVDIKKCEDEPIHLLGKVQQESTVLGFTKNAKLVFFSSCLKPYITERLVERESLHVTDFFNDDVLKNFKDFLESKKFSEVYINLVNWRDKPHRLRYAKAQNKHIILELEAVNPEWEENLSSLLSFSDGFLKSLSNYKDEKDMASNAVSYFKKLTGFDRVMYYRFDENGDGEVLAEEKSLGLESYLGLRYPAEDIPKQARELYKRNLIRSIPDVNDVGEPIYGLDYDEIVDLSYSVFRSVSPIHLQYLRNMGVTATFGTSIELDDQLYGMLICHHYSGPRKMVFHMRLLGLFFTNGISLWLQGLRVKFRDKWWNMQKEIFHGVRNHVKVASLDILLQDFWQLLANKLELIGYSIYKTSGITGGGIVLNNSTVERLAHKLLSDERNEQINAHFYVSKTEIGIVEPTTIAGLAAFKINDPDNTIILFYRAEKTKLYNWAGRPNKTEIEKGNRLTPRESFKLWQELVKDTAKPWQDHEQQFIQELASSIQSNILSRYTFKNSGKEVEMMLEKKVNELNYSIFLLEGEKKQIQEKMDIMVKTINEANRFMELKNIVMSNMSHEMRTPLNGIMGLAALIQESETIDVEIKSFGELIYQSGERMLHTFNRLMRLDLTQIDTSENKFKSINLKTFLDTNLKILSKLAKSQGQSLNWLVHNQEDFVIPDDMILGQILINLVNNALKYSGKNAIVDVDAKVVLEHDTKNIRLIVEDNGPGIDSDEFDKIFEPFYMSSNVTRSSDISSGLGLYIVKTYVNYLSGTVTVDSKLGVGTKFTVNIPVK